MKPLGLLLVCALTVPASAATTEGRLVTREHGKSIDIPLAHIAAGLNTARAAFGRGERVMLAGANGAQRELRILLVKNPAGANEVLRTLASNSDSRRMDRAAM